MILRIPPAPLKHGRSFQTSSAMSEAYQPQFPNLESDEKAGGEPGFHYHLDVTLDYVGGRVVAEWRVPGMPPQERLEVTYDHPMLVYRVTRDGEEIVETRGKVHGSSINSKVDKFLAFGCPHPSRMNLTLRLPPAEPGKPPRVEGPTPDPMGLFRLKTEIKRMGLQFKQRQEQLEQENFSSILARKISEQRDGPPLSRANLERATRRMRVQEERKGMAMAQVARRREEEARRRQHAAEAKARREAEAQAAARREAERKLLAEEVPPVPVHYGEPVFVAPSGDRALAMESWAPLELLERSALMWVSNQSDDLMCLPECRIEQLEFQVRSALRVIGAMRGRALLSDEVGLGKTIEAGLVLKEYLTRGMVRSFLVLTTPSLVDQWQEELESKFGISTRTTNEPGWRKDPRAFWAHPALVASIHTFKQERHSKLLADGTKDMLIVDEAHHLRNPSSQMWRAVNALPRQFLLLLTATPVQNSLEELYHLVTLLQPGQLPAPKEFAQRFIDRRRPRQPKAPDELRRLLNQVMIRNTRANAGIELPSRRAETVVFQPRNGAGGVIDQWEEALRKFLATLPSGRAAMKGRIILQAAGSSRAAWEQASRDLNPGLVEPVADAFEDLFIRKADAIPPLAKADAGVVVFSQFLATQAALAGHLEKQGIRVWSINGSTPSAEREPLVDAFRKEGGALLLTRGGTEGRNLQFCHRLVNFDLPWNPMEIEQRIGRLHRIGQDRVVEIYNLVTAGTLQEMLLDLLQEKLNLFELVVGETGLILGERFDSDDFGAEIFRCWHEAENGDVKAAFARLAGELDKARQDYNEVRELDETLFGEDYEVT